MVEGFTKSTPANKLYIMYLLTHVVVMVCQKYMYVIVIPCTGYLSTCTMHASIKQQHQSKQTPPHHVATRKPYSSKVMLIGYLNLTTCSSNRTLEPGSSIVAGEHFLLDPH